jgi:dTDP-4-dehydrorhamnose 3,5-epimerase
MDDSKIFILGAAGQLGLALQQKYPNAKKADIDELDITKPESINSFNWDGIEIILNAAAYTNVDGAETKDGRKAAWLVNSEAVANIAKLAGSKSITLVHVSTDYVFDGSQETHTETESFSPLSVYGASKAAGDIVVGCLEKYYILRTSWVIGDGKNFVRTMLELGKKGISPTVVSDQIGRLTFTNTLVSAIDHLLTTNSSYGTYNVSNSGKSCSWADITRTIFKDADYTLTVTDTTTEKYYEGKAGIAPRPLHSTLNIDKITNTGYTPPDWEVDLQNYVTKENNK